MQLIVEQPWPKCPSPHGINLSCCPLSNINILLLLSKNKANKYCFITCTLPKLQHTFTKCTIYSLNTLSMYLLTMEPVIHVLTDLTNMSNPIWYLTHTLDTLGTLPDIAANARPLRAWLKCPTITTHARESVADLSRNCNGFHARESVHARVTEPRVQGTGVGRDIRQSPSRVRSVFLLVYDLTIMISIDLNSTLNIDSPYHFITCSASKTSIYISFTSSSTTP